MITLEDSVEIRVTPEKVYNGLIKVFSSTEDFQKWHEDHIECYWIKGEPFEVGSILYCSENLHEQVHKMKFKALKNENNRRIEYKLLFPMSIICPYGSFVIEPKNGNSLFTAKLFFRLGWFFKKFAESRVDQITKHMKEEGENLKKLLEGKN